MSTLQVDMNSIHCCFLYVIVCIVNEIRMNENGESSKDLMRGTY